MTDTPERPKENDSPWADAKDAGSEFTKAFRSTNDFARHSTARVLGPLATKCLNGIAGLWDHYWNRKKK